MKYRPYGSTGKNISVIGCGGMRFENAEDTDTCAQIVLHAHSKGVNYFDTAPGYCHDQSEIIMGHAFRQMEPGSFYVSTKSSRKTAGELREQLERSLERFGVEAIDFFHIWCVLSLEDWASRAEALAEALKAKEEGLIRHLAISSHLPGADLARILRDYPFEGVTLGYNAINHGFRQAALDAAGEMKKGVVAMNPLGGGVIPQNPDHFKFLDSGSSVVHGALRFVISSPFITAALVGFSSIEHVDEALGAADDIEMLTANMHAEYRSHQGESIPDLCTGCGYCLPCPHGVQVPKLMDAYNMKILTPHNERAIPERLAYHWQLSPEDAWPCTRCGICEKRCTQHLPIRSRLDQIRQLEPLR